MLRSLKHLKPYAVWLIFALILVIGQAYAELTLPDYMSNIVSNGLYYDYDPITPYEVARDESGAVQYLEINGTVSNYPLPKDGIKTPIDESHPDYTLFYDGDTERLLPDYIIQDGALVPMYRLDESGNLIQMSDFRYILIQGLWMLLYAAIASLCSIANVYISSRISMGYGQAVRGKLFRKVESFSLKEIDKFGTASLITRNTNDVTQMQNFLVILIRMFALVPFFFGIALYKMIVTTSEVAEVLYLSIPLILITIVTIGATVAPIFKRMQKKVDHLTLVTRENLTGVRVIRAFDKQEEQREKFAAANRDVTATTLKASRLMSLIMPLVSFIMNLSIVGIYFLAARAMQAHYDSSTLGNMLASMTYLMHIMMSLIMMAMIFVQVPRAQASASRINEVLDTQPTVCDPKDPVSPERMGLLEFRHVNFSYHDSAEAEDVLSDITFRANPGETTAIIGATGSGKSTVLNLIPRFYDVTAGEILLDGEDIRRLTKADVRSRIGFVPQKALLFTGTVRDNMKYGHEEATDDEIWAACDIAQASEFLRDSEEGLGAEVAQGGNNFSGGQKQRLSIARALVKQPEIYVFDDSFSALDFKTEARLQAALRQKVGHATVIIVAQRISSIMNADNILVLDEGKIVAQGRHRDLLETCEIYREIAASQLSEEELNQ